MRLLSVTVAVVLCGPLAAEGLADISVFRPETGHTYTVIDGIHNWQDGRVLATAMGGYMVSITDAAENQWVKDNVFVPHAQPRGTQMWIGATDEITEGVWLWDSGELFTYSNWSAGNPNNRIDTGPPGGIGEDYASMWDSPVGTWNDYPSPSIYLPHIPGPSPIWGVVVVETIPSPSGLAMLGLAGLLTARRKR